MSVQISMRVSKEQKERLVELSKKQNKSLTQYVLDRCIIDDVARSSARVKKNATKSNWAIARWFWAWTYSTSGLNRSKRQADCWHDRNLSFRGKSNGGNLNGI